VEPTRLFAAFAEIVDEAFRGEPHRDPTREYGLT
jgi:hypothetical protein